MCLIVDKADTEKLLNQRKKMTVYKVVQKLVDARLRKTSYTGPIYPTCQYVLGQRVNALDSFGNLVKQSGFDRHSDCVNYGAYYGIHVFTTLKGARKFVADGIKWDGAITNARIMECEAYIDECLGYNKFEGQATFVSVLPKKFVAKRG